jgi:hypothetical protein
MGSVSVYVQSHLLSGSSAVLEIVGVNNWAINSALIRQLYNGGFETYAVVGGVISESEYPIGNPTPLDWHLFDISTDLNGLTVKLDGATVLTNPSITSFQHVLLEIWGDGEGSSAYFDDFSANTVAVPEPTSWTLMAISFGSLALIRRKR